MPEIVTLSAFSVCQANVELSPLAMLAGEAEKLMGIQPEAVEVAKHMKGTPVKTVWTREDDLQHDTYRPASYTKFIAALDAEGYPAAIHAKVVSPPFGQPGVQTEGIRDMKYAVPNFRVEQHSPDVGIPVSYWRSVGYSQNTFFMESFLDELATAAGKDPLEYRRKLLEKQPRMLAVLNLAAEKAGWGKPLPAGRFRGIAVVNNIGSFNAIVAEVSAGIGEAMRGIEMRAIPDSERLSTRGW